MSFIYGYSIINWDRVQFNNIHKKSKFVLTQLEELQNQNERGLYSINITLFPFCLWHCQLGMHLCVAGWMDGGKVGYPICFPSLKCGENHVGLVMYRDPVPQSSKYDAYCYRLDGTRTRLYWGVATCTGLMALIKRDLLSECPPRLSRCIVCVSCWFCWRWRLL